MSYLVNDVEADYTDRSTGNRQVRAFIVADTAADLPANTTALTWLLGSHAKTVDTGDEYWIDSSGSWILQPSSSAFSNVYTKAETDALLSPIDAAVNTQESSLANLIDTGGKNVLHIDGFSGGNFNGLTYSVDSDGVVTISGNKTNPSLISYTNLRFNNAPLYIDSLCDGDHVLSGCPAGGSSTTFRLYAAKGSYARYDTGNGVLLTPTTETNIQVVIAIAAGYDLSESITFKPMICKKSDFDLSPDFVPYCPTLAELYALVRSYHP